jgi:hypothetical protein
VHRNAVFDGSSESRSLYSHQEPRIFVMTHTQRDTVYASSLRAGVELRKRGTKNGVRAA